MTFIVTQSSFRKPITPWHDHLPFSFSVYSSSIALSVMTSHMPTFLSHIHLFIFFISFFFLNKPELPFHHYIALPYPLLDCEIFSFIVLPIFVYKLVLTDVGFLKAHLSTSLAPSSSSPYLGYRLEFNFLVLGGLHDLMARSLTDNHGNTSMSLDH